MPTHGHCIRALVCAAAIAAWPAGQLVAQGVTTAAIRGRVVDDTGSPIAGAALDLTNTTTGQQVHAQSRAGGLYNFENVPVGGPYTLAAHAVGYRPQQRTDIVLRLGQAADFDVTLERSPVTLAEITVTGEPTQGEFAPTRKGTATMISDTLLSRLPTLDRQFTDFVDLTPQVAEADAGGVSVAGQNNRYNAIQIDGSTVNDRFGLGSTGLTGGQANGRAIGLDAVKEYEVLLAPYDVRKGNFTGALINAVTKSGTNAYRVSGFYYYRNQGLAGQPLSLGNFYEHQFGASVGGPITPDKAWFFLNVELRRESAPARGPYIGQSASAGTPLVVNQSDVDAFNAALQNYGLPTGSAGLVTNPNPLANIFARVDLQVGSNSRLVLRYIYDEANDNIFSRTSSINNPVWNLSNAGYQFKNRTNNPGIQFFTNFASGASNELLASLNRIRDARNPNVLAPLITVAGFNSATGSGTYRLSSGSERYSQGNRLNQDIWELTDNLTIPKGTHSITVGTRNELYKVYNLFAQSSYGVWTFNSLADFQAGVASRYEGAGDLGGGIPAVFTQATLGLYAQDQWQVSPTFNLTYGVRADVPVFFDQPNYDSRVTAAFGNRGVPSGQILWGPRVGFNWDVGGDQTNQLRGGAGLFTGTPAFVWMSNAFSNTGTSLGRITCSGANTPTFTTATADYANPPLQCADGTGLGRTTIGEVDLIGNNTKYPQVLRANLAYEHRLPGNALFSVEGIYTRGINDYFIVNRNLSDPVGTNAHGRVMYGTYNANGTSYTNYVNYTLYGPSYNGGVFDLINTSHNYSWSVTAQLRKHFSERWEASLSYTHSAAHDVQSFTSSRAISNWLYGRAFSVAQTNDVATRSVFDRPHRIVASATYTFPWTKFRTDLSFSYIGQSGQPYMYLAGGSSGRGDLNADGTNANDPIYIPTDATTDMQFADITSGGTVTTTAAQEAAAFNQFIDGESCLTSQRGQIMQRNSCRNPWQNFLNVSLRQGLPALGTGHPLTLEVSVFNLLNLLNKNWGVVKTAGGGVYGTETLLNMVAANGTEPVFQFDPANLQNRFTKVSSPGNSYQVQLGVRFAY